MGILQEASEIRERIARAKQLVAEAERLMDGGPRKSAGRSAGRSGGSSVGNPRGGRSDTLGGALQKLLKGRTMSVTEMAAKVQDAGYKTDSPNFRTIVNACLIKPGNPFKRVARGRYTAK